jgi:hypothetical protein
VIGSASSTGQVSAILKRKGVPMRGRGLTPAQVDEAVDLYQLGWSLARIGERLGATATTVMRRIRERGVITRAHTAGPE